jgi:uncharacterized protein (TIGR00369 family)
MSISDHTPQLPAFDPIAEGLTPLPHSAQNHCFGCGPENSVGLKLRFYLSADHTVVAVATLGNQYEGPPGYLHGGILANLLDEVMSKANRARGHIALTRKLEVEYLRPVPSTKPFRLEGSLLRVEGRKLFPTARILNAEGTVLATASALFIEFDPNRHKV